jgi:hypothetical protein
VGADLRWEVAIKGGGLAAEADDGAGLVRWPRRRARSHGLLLARGSFCTHARTHEGDGRVSQASDGGSEDWGHIGYAQR